MSHNAAIGDVVDPITSAHGGAAAGLVAVIARTLVAEGGAADQSGAGA